MNYDALTHQYWQKQITRIANLRDKIRAKGSPINNGRVIPEGYDLALGEGRTMNLAVMFIDICGFSQRPMGSANEQAVMLAALNLFFSEMIKVAEDYTGTVEKNTGDGLMAYFQENGGLPPASGAKRAVACALTMFAANENLITPILKASNIEPFDFRISIEYGEVTIASLGVARGFKSYAAIGAPANFAAKMLGKARKNEIVIGASLKNQLPPQWQNQFTSPHPEPSGWSYTNNGTPYPLYTYHGRWNNLQG